WTGGGAPCAAVENGASARPTRGRSAHPLPVPADARPDLRAAAKGLSAGVAAGQANFAPSFATPTVTAKGGDADVTVGDTVTIQATSRGLGTADTRGVSIGALLPLGLSDSEAPIAPTPSSGIHPRA